MAIVVDLGNPGQPIDKPWTTFNRKNAGEPNPSLVPQYAGEIVLDTTNNVLWKCLAPTPDSWVALTSF